MTALLSGLKMKIDKQSARDQASHRGGEINFRVGRGGGLAGFGKLQSRGERREQRELAGRHTLDCALGALPMDKQPLRPRPQIDLSGKTSIVQIGVPDRENRIARSDEPQRGMQVETRALLG